jgi:soluble lytic murein transglycosylase
MKKTSILLFMLTSIAIASCGFIGELKEVVISKEDGALESLFPSASPSATQSTIFPKITSLESAEQFLFAGEFTRAMDEFLQVFNQSNDVEIKARALFGIGRTQNRARNCTSAVDSFNRILGQYPTASVVPEVYFYLGRCYAALQEYPQSIDAYEKYLASRAGIVDEIVRENQAEAAKAMNDFQNVITFYQSSLQSFSDPASKARINLKIGQAYTNLQNYTTAIQIYQSVYEATDDSYTKASADLLMGQAFIKLEMIEEATRRLMDAVIQFPRAYDSYTALQTLLLRGIKVDDKLRGIVEYYFGDYKNALLSFERYLSSQPDGEDGTVYYYKGLSHYFLIQPGFAIQAYDQLIQNYPASRFWAAAWDEKAYVQWTQLEEYTNAATTLRTFASRSPKSVEAPAYLFEAGRILERKSDLEGAIEIWRQLSDEYPSYTRSYEAIFLSGIANYRLNKFDEALNHFQRNAILATSKEDKAAAYMWIGKCYQAKNDIQNAMSFWKQAEKADPTDYYSIRAGQLIQNKKPTDVEKSYDLGYDLDYERPEAESWLKSTFKINDNVDLSGTGELDNDPRMKKANELWALDIFDEAVGLFEKIQEDNSENPLNTFQLMNHFHSLGLYRLSINAARNILDLAGMDDLSSLSAPIFFTHIRFGAYFRQQMIDGIQGRNINPLVLYSLLRQESLFDTTIVSSAGARGMAQFMPATAKETSDLLGWPPAYSVEDLNRPVVAIRFAAHYLDRITTRFVNGDLLAGLAAYNSGPTNSQIWQELSRNDPDLFLEIIRLPETRTYLKHIIEFLNIYQLVYTH